MSTGEAAEPAPRGDGWDATRKRVLDRDDHACRFCGIGDDEHRAEHDRGLHVHHIIPDRDGGRDDPKNLIAVCGSCHRTLEHTHGRAVAEMKRREDHTDDLEDVTRVWREHRDTVNALDDALAEFAGGHPTFADEFVIHETYDGCVEAREFQEATATCGDIQIGSEWAFAVAWGYKEGVLDVVSALNGRTDVPFDDVDDVEA